MTGALRRRPRAGSRRIRRRPRRPTRPHGPGRDERQLFGDAQDDPDHQEGEGRSAGGDVDERAQAPGPGAGDRLKLTAELQVTLDCHKRAPSCAGRPYLFNPRVGSQLVLARGPGATGGPGATPVSSRHVIRCRGRPLSSRQHHCVLVFTHASFDVHRLGALPCSPGSCRVNMVIDASNRHARRGDKLVIGANKPGGRIVQDRGRINAIRLRPGSQPPPPMKVTRKRRHRSVPLDATRTVVLSKRLAGLRKGAQLAVWPPTGRTSRTFATAPG